MLIIPALSAKSYYHNYKVEQSIGDIISYITGLTITDIGNSYRPEYDMIASGEFKSDYDVPFTGSCQLELKTSAGATIPVETHKDSEQTIPSGLLTSTSPIIIVLTVSGDIGKLRAFKRTVLLNSINSKYRHTFDGKASECAVQYSIPCSIDNPPHIWLGDFLITSRVVDDRYIGILSESFSPSAVGGLQLTEWIREFAAKQQNVEMY